MKVITIQLLNQQYSIKCGDDEVENLKHSASLLNAKMLEVKQLDKSMDSYNVLMLAALNISSECFKSNQKSSDNFNKMSSMVQALESKIQSTLNASEKKHEVEDLRT